MRTIIKSASDEKIIANSLISLSMLDSYLEDKNDEQLFRKYLAESNSILVKISAAIALVNILEEDIDPAPIDYILKEIPTIIDLNLSPYEFPWNDGELLGFITEVIKFCSVQSPEKVIPDLSKVLAKNHLAALSVRIRRARKMRQLWPRHSLSLTPDNAKGRFFL